MRIFLRVLDAIAALWLIGAFVLLLGFSPFLFDSPYATLGSAVLTFFEGLSYVASIPIVWILIRLVQHYARKKR